MDSFSHLITSNIKQTTSKLERYSWLLKKTLPAECDIHFNVANIHNKTLVIVADSPVWTSRIRQLGPNILAIMKTQSNEDLHHIKVITRRGPTVDNHKPLGIQRKLSTKASQLLEQTASFLPDDELSKALLRLSKRKSDSKNKG